MEEDILIKVYIVPVYIHYFIIQSFLIRINKKTVIPKQLKGAESADNDQRSICSCIKNDIT